MDHSICFEKEAFCKLQQANEGERGFMAISFAGEVENICGPFFLFEGRGGGGCTFMEGVVGITKCLPAKGLVWLAE